MKNVLLYFLLIVLFLPPLLMFLPIAFFMILLLLPLIPYFISLEVIEKATKGLISSSNPEKEGKKKSLPWIHPYLAIIAIIMAIVIIIRWDGLLYGLAYIAFFLLSSLGLYTYK
ncbi:hypothetical protein [Alkaliphilus serpentinus]|uniref:Uncharacterized protein n=1 Tax=Alkaliphilus serpentinus TaxID=1482731 RepID=A0A833MEQ6_9FIRM|nr:hypothetical protein [Alkaliphilus serpentinus]KAB3531779.1 hypothetical protein F8153_03415 [Alkaliphilus serpentinus]